MNTTLIYISVPGATVFESQVLSLLKEIESLKYFGKIILLAGIKDENQWQNLIERNKRYNIDVVRFKSYPNYHFYSRKQSKEFLKVFTKIVTSNTVIHLRGESFAFSVKQALKKTGKKNVKVISDIRGAAYEESSLYGKKSILLPLKLYQLKRNVKKVRKNNDFISCVSAKLKDYILERSNIEESKIVINHCMAGREFTFSQSVRDQYRKKLNINEDDILFLFITGANRAWQNTDEVIFGLANNGYKVLNLSKKEINHLNVINMFVPYNEVPNYLNASDIGVIWRNDDMVNNVASPIKFSEYVCCGLPILTNNGVELINQYIKSSNNGMIIENLVQINKEEINRLISLDRNLIGKLAQNKFSSESISKNYLSIYKQMIEE